MSPDLKQKLRGACFELSNDDTLVCIDPTIGRLENKGKDMKVRFNRESGELELCVGGDVAQAFELKAGARRACMDACAAYWTAFEETCRCPLREHEAA